MYKFIPKTILAVACASLTSVICAAALTQSNLQAQIDTALSDIQKSITALNTTEFNKANPTIYATFNNVLNNLNVAYSVFKKAIQNNTNVATAANTFNGSYQQWLKSTNGLFAQGIIKPTPNSTATITTLKQQVTNVNTLLSQLIKQYQSTDQ